MLIGHAQHAYVLSMCGRTEEALAAARRAHELDPLSASVRFEPFVLWNARRFGDALAGWEALERLMPGLFFVTMWRAIALVALERHSEALALLRQHADAYTDNWSRLTTAALLAACGDIAGARSRLARLHEQERTEYMWPIGFAMAYGFLGKTDRAFQYLERAYEDRAGWITLLPTGSLVDPLRGDARLDALIRKIGAPGEPTSYRPPVRRLAKPSVAVLPLTNMSASADDEYFADGMTEDIIAQLSKVASLKVISRTSVMRYKKTDKNVGEVAKDLGASHVVEGSVRRAGQRLRIVTQLIEAATDAHLWAETFDRDQADVFAIQTEVATRVATGLRQRLSAVEERLVSKRPTADLEAYNLYLLGRRHYNLALGDDL